MNATRAQVYAAIDTERVYQNTIVAALFDQPPGGATFTVGEHLVMVKEYTDRALRAWVDGKGDESALHVVRKIAGICVRCMEQHGAPPRIVTVDEASAAGNG